MGHCSSASGPLASARAAHVLDEEGVAPDEYSVFLINHAGILENIGSNMGQKSVMNDIFDPFRALGSVRNGFAMYFSSRLSPSKLRTTSKSSQNQSFPLNHSGMIKEKHRVLLLLNIRFLY